MKTITDISKYINKLSKKDKELFYRIYNFTEDFGTLKIPLEMREWTLKTFGDVKSVEKQKIIRIDNNVMFETALFNELRTKRPIDMKTTEDVEKIIKEKIGDPFCKPLTATPKDSFGRIKGKKCITASNIAKYDAMHGLVIFNEHNPLKFSLEDIKDYIDTTDKWIKKAHKENPDRKFP
ncbi:MAG: hypothetical protein KKF95_04865, partial [Nanoarchaeota archaeon]|nr:hypothetical protein [Nanoarchaeota archaeon]